MCYRLPAILMILCGFFNLSACSDFSSRNDLSSLKVEVWYGQQPLGCEQWLDLSQDHWAVQQFAFFISQLSVEQNGQTQNMNLTVNDSQSADVALLSFSAQACAQHGASDKELKTPEPADSALFSQTLTFTRGYANDEHSQLRFMLGLPFAQNHQNPLTQAAPLNVPAMFWSWRGGHKFLRLDLQSQQQAWHFHLGSNGCVADSAMRAPDAQCSQPNVVPVTLKRQQQGQRLIVHLDRLLNQVEVNTRSYCSMQPSQSSCDVLLANLHDAQVFEWQ